MVTQDQDIQGPDNRTLYTVFFINWTINSYFQPYCYVIFFTGGEQR